MNKTITVSSMLFAYGQMEAPDDLEGFALAAHVRQAYDDGDLELSPDWGTERNVVIDGSPSIPLYCQNQSYDVQVLLPDTCRGSDGYQPVVTQRRFAESLEQAVQEARAVVAEQFGVDAEDCLVLGAFSTVHGEIEHTPLYTFG